MTTSDAVGGAFAAANGVIDKLELAGCLNPNQKARLAAIQLKLAGAGATSRREDQFLGYCVERYLAKVKY